ncbi:acyltransferase family protein [Actinoplanes sp. ATCC 53533]|uniref:acyltransferase family protein n=1 Tax=Actinoplanes sp. ATCC 53533 TaxID=1288362 RepID=UPI00131562E1|nr:acyltransferase family protein [Actinoplanes sp. ATCC 53533]
MSAFPRDRTIDAARAGAIVGVVAGHWLVTGLVPGPDGVTTASPLSMMPALAPVTWLLQTLGLLFFAGGYAAARQPVRRPGPRNGIVRLVRAVLGLLAGLAIVLFAGAALGLSTATLSTITGLVVSPLWFLLPYLGLRAAAGPLRRVVSRVGVLAVLPPIAMVAAGDLGLLPGLVALPAAWSVPWLLGMALAARDEGRTPRATSDLTAAPAPKSIDRVCTPPPTTNAPADTRTANGSAGAPPSGAGGWVGTALVCNGVTVLAALILFAGYPVSAVGVPGQGRSNLDPPSLAAVALAVTQIGVFLMLRGPLGRLLRHDRAWRPVAALNRVAVPVYLGHQSVLLAVAGAAALLDPAMPGLLTAPGSTDWVWHRLAWLPVLGGLLALAIHRRSASQRG